MKLVILQPSFAPWCGYFDQMAQADLFILYDVVAYDRHGWRNRNRIKTPQGAQWLTVPVLTKNQNKPLVKDILIDNQLHWRETHIKAIKQNYSRTPFFDQYIDLLECVYQKEWVKLVDLNVTLTTMLKNLLGIQTKLLRASELPDPEGDRVGKLIWYCKRFNANEFLEGNAGRDYLAGAGEAAFEKEGIKLTYHNYEHPVYPQLYGEFLSFTSVIDLLFNCGTDSLQILLNKRGGHV